MALNIIDVSSWQPNNITKLVDYDGVIIKATQGNWYVSPACDPQYQSAKKRGKLLGVYHFAQGGDAKTEARFFVNNIKGYLGEATLWLDYEAGATKRGRRWAKKFCDTVEDMTGQACGVYGSHYVLDDQGFQKLSNKLWVADYDANPVTVGYHKVNMLLDGVIRQYTSKGKLDGYSGRLDFNYSILSKPQWQKLANTVVSDKPKDKLSVKELARLVIAGKYGNGATRRRKLGKRYDKVQDKVNKLLGHPKVKRYKVKSGDTLWGISRKLGTTIERLVKLNDIKNPDLIYAGAKLRY